MDRRVRETARWTITAASLMWMVYAGWWQFSAIPERELQTHSSADVQDRLRDCEGSFQKRYECKEAIVIKTHRDTFYNLVERLAIVVMPAILGGAAFAYFFPKRLVTRKKDVEEDPDAWKRRAERQTRVRPVAGQDEG
ncbi:MAG: hypothetical protein HYU60_02810 [Magnetospirillum sp.]|nr:hypothetical protein [Magnetospirillum sp.]